MNTIESKSKFTNRHPPGTNTAVLLVSFVLAVGTVGCLYAQVPISPTKSLLLEWPVPAEDCIVVGTTSLTSSVWMPWPQPIFKRFGKLCMAVPATNCLECFGLVPGTQFSDDFDSLKEPFAARNDWEPFFVNPTDASRFTFTIANGVFLIQTQALPVGGMVMVFCPGAGEIVRDFYASVDILDWGSSSQNSALGIAGRVQGGPGSVDNMYLGSLQVNPMGQPGKGGLYFFNGANDVPPPATELFDVTPGSHYRLQFSAVGNRLSLRLLDLTNGQALVAERGLQNSTFAQGRVALWVNTRGSTNYTRTVDNFFVTGTKP